ncbi:FMRFamide-activated amiloride-sensitive sodium channel-like [Lineus longissimus]|uniref:FMRFamide-activated amiloride-sensitive sodium channel-like n=1 Tax=Lineus longissimus TaxID=88925 RepID=UPI00315D9927
MDRKPSSAMKRNTVSSERQKLAPWPSYDVSEAPTTTRGIFIKFGLMSTIRGIPRILRARNKYLTILWATTVLAFLVLSFFQVYQIVDGYLSYTVKQERHIKLSRSATFPDITVCSLQPFRSKKSVMKDKVDNAAMLINDYFFNVAHRVLNQSLSDYMESEFQYQTGAVHWTRDNEHYYDDEDSEPNAELRRRRRSPKHMPRGESNHLVDDETMRNMLMTTAGLYQNIPLYQRRKLGHQKTMIDQCTYTVQTVKEKRLQTVNCTIEAFYYPQFFSCYTISLGDHKGIVVELVVNLFLDDDVSLQYPKHYTRDEDSQKHGVRVVIHEPYSYPDVQRDGHDVPPGVSANFVIKTTKLKHLAPPYGSCAHNVEPIKDMDGKRFEYRKTTCEQQAIQRKINTYCHCIDPGKITDPVTSVSLPYCMDIGFSKSVISHRLACMYDFNMNPPGSYQCSTRCTYYIYSTTIDMAKWPHESFHLQLYETAQKNRNVSFPHLDEAIKKLKHADSNVNETQLEMSKSMVTDWLLKRHVFQRNFVSLTVSRPSFEIDYVVDVPEIDVPTLVSRIGGIMSFWLGITFITIIEFVEVVYDAVSLMLKNRKERLRRKNPGVENRI